MAGYGYNDISDDVVTEAISNGDCSPKLCEQMQEMLVAMANAIINNDTEIMEQLAEQWIGD